MGVHSTDKKLYTTYSATYYTDFRTSKEVKQRGLVYIQIAGPIKESCVFLNMFSTCSSVFSTKGKLAALGWRRFDSMISSLRL